MPSFFLLLWKQLVDSSLLLLPILPYSIETKHQHLIPGPSAMEEHYQKRSLKDKQKVSPAVPITLQFLVLWKLKSILTDTKYKESLTQIISKLTMTLEVKTHTYIKDCTYSGSRLFSNMWTMGYSYTWNSIHYSIQGYFKDAILDVVLINQQSITK